MPDVHALLSASSSKQWLHCPPSVRLQEGFPNESSVYAAEGTFAHEVCEYKVRKYLKERVKRPQSEECSKLPRIRQGRGGASGHQSCGSGDRQAHFPGVSGGGKLHEDCKRTGA